MVLLGLSARLGAQETMPAVNLSRESLSGYTTAGVGWSFVPATDIIVTGIFSTAPQVDFWQGSNQVIATYYYAGSPSRGSTNFQPVQPLHLTARKRYFISTQQTNFSSIVLELIYGLGAINDTSTTFTPSPYIQQFASYYLSTNLLWSSPAAPTYMNTNFLLLGPNFQFQLDPDSTAPWINMNFEESTILSSTPTGYGFNTGIADVPGWTVYYGWGASNYSGGTTLVYNNQTLDAAGVSLEGPNYWTPAIGGNYSVLLQGGTISSQIYSTNGASIGQTNTIPPSAQSITYWSRGLSFFRSTFNGHLLSFFPVQNATNHILYAADISSYAGQTGELLFTAPWPNGGGMIDNIRFNSFPIPRPTLQIQYSPANVTISWQPEYTYWSLESSTNAGPASTWSTVTNVSTITASQISIIDTVTNAARFYRLRSQ